MSSQFDDGGELPDGVTEVTNDTGELELVTFLVTTTRRLNIRAEPSLEATVLDIAEAGAVLEAVGRDDGWVQLADNGYVKEEFVR